MKLAATLVSLIALSVHGATVHWTNTAGINSAPYHAGDTVILWGTFTNAITVTNSGAAGNPVTFLFSDGAKIAIPSIPETGGIALGSYNHITIDGGSNGIIESTANGSGQGQTNSYGIRETPNAGGISVENMTIRNLYVRTNDQDVIESYGVYLYGVMSNITVRNCTFTWGGAGIALVYGVGDSYNFQIISNTIDYVNIGTVFGSANNGGAKLTGATWAWNRVNNFREWDNPGANTFHHNGLFAWADHVGATITNLYITNNYIGGAWGETAHGTSGIGLSGDPGIIYNTIIANNVVSFLTGGAGNGAVRLFNTTKTLVANNTFHTATADLSMARLFTTMTDVVFTNNIFSGFDIGFYSVPQATSLPTASDKNIFHNTVYYARLDSDWLETLAAWQAYGFDSNSLTNDPLFVSAATGNYQLQSGSPAIGAGANLSGVFNIDITGATRSAPWDIGAYEYGSSPAPEAPGVRRINAGRVIVR